MIYVLINSGVVFHCVSVDSVEDLREYYPEALILPQQGDENVGWLYDGVSFSPPE